MYVDSARRLLPIVCCLLTCFTGGGRLPAGQLEVMFPWRSVLIHGYRSGAHDGHCVWPTQNCFGSGARIRVIVIQFESAGQPVAC